MYFTSASAFVASPSHRYWYTNANAFRHYINNACRHCGCGFFVNIFIESKLLLNNGNRFLRSAFATVTAQLDSLSFYSSFCRLDRIAVHFSSQRAKIRYLMILLMILLAIVTIALEGCFDLPTNKWYYAVQAGYSNTTPFVNILLNVFVHKQVRHKVAPGSESI